MAQQFGKTWWGEQFLKSLTAIDYTNRLPRGRTYARNGSVLSINLTKNKIEAQVQGSRRKPYKVKEVTVPLFSNADKAILMNTIKKDPLLLSYLLNRELPSELNTLAVQNNISIFPKTWNDFEMHCSCPDWAVPCKHLAAVIYMISAEIDINPFRIFQLHGLNILDELTKEGMKPEKDLLVSKIEDIIQENSIQLSKINSIDANNFDLSKISNQTDKLLSLLEERSLFFDKAFVPILRKNYKAVARHIKSIQNTETVQLELKDFDPIESVQLILNQDLSFYQAILKFENNNIIIENDDKKNYSSGFDSLIDFVSRLPYKYLNHFSKDINTLFYGWHLSLKLAENGAFIPQILNLSYDQYIIRWIPALINEEVESLLNLLENGIRSDFIKVKIHRNEYKQFAHREMAISLVSVFLNHFIEQVNHHNNFDYNNPEYKIQKLFFKNKVVSFQQLGEKQIPEAIHQYLKRFFINEKSFVPLIKVDDLPKSNNFEFQLWVENRKDLMQRHIPLYEFLSDKNNNQYKTSVFQSLASLAHDFEEIKPLISSSGSNKLYFDSDTFAEVLLNILPIVKLLGIRILLPNSLKDLTRPKPSLKLESKDSTSAKSYLNLKEMLEFEWQIAIGNKTIPVKEFEKLVKGISGVVNIKGEYVLIDQKEIATLLNNLDIDKQLNNTQLLQSALTEEYKEAKITLSEDVKRLIQELLQSKNKKLPTDLNATLRPYQERGYEWLYNNSKIGFGSIIADDMGLGKTLQVISLLLQFKQEGRLKKHRALVVVPTTLISNWQKEIEKFAPDLTPHIYHGPNRQFEIKNCDILITSYGILRSDIDIFQKNKWELFVIDEAQNIKNPGTEQTKAVKKIKANVKIAMSGTPVENRLSEYWSIFDFINKGYLGSMKNFKKTFATPIESDNSIDQLERFKKITEPFILRRLKTDKSIISDLPEKIEHDCFIELAKEQTALYQNVVDSMMKIIETTESDSIQRKGIVFKMMTALKQVCNHPSQYLKKEDDSINLSGKTKMLIELIREILDNKEKVLIFTQYKEMGEILSRILEKEFHNTPLFLHGRVSRSHRDEMVDDFQSKPHKKLFILSIKAGGTGLNLTEANHVIHFDLWWNPAVEAQATDRAFRIGQKKNVMVHRFICKGTFEEKINEMLQEKKHLADLTVSAGEKWIGDLSNKEIQDLVNL